MPRNKSSSQASIRTTYDLASEAYARKFIGELDHKPLDLELLKHFSSLVGAERPVLDIGCGPGHTTAHLNSLGLMPTGVDLSPKLIEKASEAFPQSRFVGEWFGDTALCLGGKEARSRKCCVPNCFLCVPNCFLSQPGISV